MREAIPIIIWLQILNMINPQIIKICLGGVLLVMLIYYSNFNSFCQRGDLRLEISKF